MQEAGNRAFGGGLFESALNNYLQALELAKKTADLSFISDSSRGLAKTYLQLGKVEEALHAAQEADANDREFWGYENQQVCEDMFLTAEALRRQENFAQARKLFARVRELNVMFFGEMHDHTLEVLVKLIWLDLQEGRSESLDSLTQHAVEVFSTLHPAGAFTKALNIKFLLQPYMEQNRQQDAELISNRIQQTLRTVLGATHPEIRQALSDCSAVMKTANRHMAAWHLQSRADVIEKKDAVDRWAQPASAPTILVDGIPVLVHQSNPELAKERAQQLAAARAKKDGTPTKLQILTWQQLWDEAEKALSSGLYDAALDFLLDALDSARKADDHASVSETLRKLTKLYLDIDMVAQAEKAAREAAEIDRAFWGDENPHLSSDQFLLAETLRRQEKFAQARMLLESVLAVRIQVYGAAHGETLSTLIRLIWLDLQEHNDDSLIEHTAQSAEVFSQCQPRESFSELLDLKSLMQPYIERNLRPEVESICNKMESVARTVFGESNKELPFIAADCSTVKKSLDRAPVGGKLNMQWHPGEKINAGDLRPHSADGDLSGGNFSSRSEENFDTSVPTYRDNLSATGASAGTTGGAYGASTISGMLMNVCRRGLNLAGTQMEPKSFISLSIGCAAAAGLCSAATYCLAGYFALSIESFAIVFLGVAVLILGVLQIMIMLRQNSLQTQLPNVLEIIASLLQAGTPITQALKQVSETSPEPIGAEFQRVVVALQEGKSFSQAFAQMMSYARLPQLAQLSDAINANRSSGGNLARHVSVIAKEIREAEKERRLLLKRSAPAMALITGFALLVVLNSIWHLGFDPAASAAFLDSALTKVILFLICAAPPAFLLYAAKSSRSRENGSLKLPATALGAFIHKQIMRDRLRNELSKFLDVVVMYVQSGVSVPQAVQMVRNEASASCPTLARELDVTLHNLTSFKSSLPLAFRKIGEQYDVRELVTLAATLDAASQLGGSVGSQLLEQSESLRDHLSKAGQARAASLSSIAMLIGVTLFALFFLISKLLAPHVQ